MTLEDLKLPNLEGWDVRTGYNLCTEKEQKERTIYHKSIIFIWTIYNLSYSDYFRLVHVTCCKETATLPLWIRLMNFSIIVKVTILVARPSGAANLSHTAPWHNLQP